ncbi:MAG: CidA/LrgA family protein [Streptococcaceae bacterium]|jgi:holin-like protein|nr:CidA/LrgA family protein [Streptococcaceae bacterium]
MKIYLQILIILLFSFVGEILSDALHLPIPGSIIGMILLFLALQTGLLKVKQVDTVGNFMLNNMTILFLPAGVGILAKWPLISHFWWQIVVIILVALIVNVFILGKVTEFIKVKFEGDYLPPELTSQQIALDVLNQHTRNKIDRGEL